MNGKLIAVLAVLVIATVALTGVANATAVKVTGVTAEGAYFGVPVVTHPAGVQFDVIGYNYVFFPTGKYTVTFSDGSVATGIAGTLNKDGTVTIGETAYAYAIPTDGALHTLTGVGASGESILFVNGKPTTVVTASGTAPFDPTFYKTVAKALDLTGNVQPVITAPHSFESWMQ